MRGGVRGNEGTNSSFPTRLFIGYIRNAIILVRTIFQSFRKAQSIFDKGALKTLVTTCFMVYFCIRKPKIMLMTKEKLPYDKWCQRMCHTGLGVNGCLNMNERPTSPYFRELRLVYMGLDRYLEAHEKWDMYQTALKEIGEGKKKSHWIWFVFPQLRGLSKSDIGDYYGICGRWEAEEYINHPILRERLIEATEAVYNNEKSVYEIFGNDAIKVRSCMLLFASICDIPIFKKMVSRYGWQ